LSDYLILFLFVFAKIKELSKELKSNKAKQEHQRK